MFSFNSLRRNWARSVFALLAVAFLSTTLLFTGCKTEADDDDDPYQLPKNSTLIGSWISGPNYSSYDGYVITANKLSHFSGSTLGSLSLKYRGTIMHVTKFSDTSGVIIMKYDNGLENVYPEYDASWNIIGTLPLSGEFIGIYYRNLVPNVSAGMGTAYLNDGGLPVAEQATLKAAIAAYTAERGVPGSEGGPADSYMYSYGAYNNLPTMLP